MTEDALYDLHNELTAATSSYGRAMESLALARAAEALCVQSRKAAEDALDAANARCNDVQKRLIEDSTNDR